MQAVLPRVYSCSVAGTGVYDDTYVNWGVDLDNYVDNNVHVVTGDAYDIFMLTIIPTWLHVTVVTVLMAMYCGVDFDNYEDNNVTVVTLVMPMITMC